MAKRKKSEELDRLCLVGKQWDDSRLQYDDLVPTSMAIVHAPSDAVFGSIVLIASKQGQYVDAIGDVVGQPTHYKHAKSSRSSS